MSIKLLEETLELREQYSIFVDENEDYIINQFCEKIRKDKVGDLNLDEYTAFLFWVDVSEKDLKKFYKKFKHDVADSTISYTNFCEFLWMTISNEDEDIPEELREVKEILDGKMKGIA